MMMTTRGRQHDPMATDTNNGMHQCLPTDKLYSVLLQRKEGGIAIATGPTVWFLSHSNLATPFTSTMFRVRARCRLLKRS